MVIEPDGVCRHDQHRAVLVTGESRSDAAVEQLRQPMPPGVRAHHDHHGVTLLGDRGEGSDRIPDSRQHCDLDRPGGSDRINRGAVGIRKMLRVPVDGVRVKRLDDRGTVRSLSQSQQPCIDGDAHHRYGEFLGYLRRDFHDVTHVTRLYADDDCARHRQICHHISLPQARVSATN